MRCGKHICLDVYANMKCRYSSAYVYHLDIRNAVVPLMMPLASCDVCASHVVPHVNFMT